jgi:hypothetical protein
VNNAQRIILALDSRLNGRVDLTLYGRAAIQLGFDAPPEGAVVSRDVDAVLRLGQAEELNRATNFWQAVEEVNRELAGDDLYISHFFVEDQVALTPEWIANRRRIDGPWQRIEIYRLGDCDLLLSKLMRDDPLDQADALFIARAAGLSMKDIQTLLARARVPDVAEIREQFAKASERFLLAARGMC